MTDEEYKAKVQSVYDIEQRDRFACAALVGLLGSQHFAPGGKRISEIDWEGKSIGEIGRLEVESLVPTPKDQDDYMVAIVDMANGYADMMMKARE